VKIRQDPPIKVGIPPKKTIILFLVIDQLPPQNSTIQEVDQAIRQVQEEEVPRVVGKISNHAILVAHA
jgi:HD-like signal output (HDOD) protein